MSEFLLVRHAVTDAVGCFLAGRKPGIPLNAEGRRQAARLAHELAGTRISRIISSPLERACETAAAIAAPHGMPVVIDDAFNELDFGAWTGRTFESLEDDPLWHQFNIRRSATRPPGGETMQETQARAIAGMRRLARELRGGTVVVVSHADVIRAVLLYYRNLPIDAFLQLQIDTASVGSLRVDPE